MWEVLLCPPSLKKGTERMRSDTNTPFLQLNIFYWEKNKENYLQHEKSKVKTIYNSIKRFTLSIS